MTTNEEREMAAMAEGNLLPYAGLITPYPVWAVVYACGVTRQGDKYKGVATGLFQDDYETCIDLNDTALHNYFKASAALTVANGQIKFTIQQRNNIRAFVQWTKDAIRTGRDPAAAPFQPIGIAKILRRAETHKLYVSNSDSNAVKPRDLTKEIKWADWAPSFENYLRAIPGRIGVPLSYVIRDNDVPDPTPNVDFLDDYIMNAPLSGADYLTDRRSVHTKLVALITTNPEAEALIKLNEKEADGREDWKSLKIHYEGQGMFAIDIRDAEKILNNLVYQGEKPPGMYWAKFEQQLNTAFATYVKVEKRVVHSDSMKLRHLMDKVRCDKLAAVSAAITVAIQSNPDYSYADALKVYKSTVAKSGSASQSMNSDRQIREQNQNSSGQGYGRGFGRGPGRGFYSGRGRDGRGRGRGYSGRGNYQHVPKTVDGSRFFNLTDGTRIEYHPLIDYPQEIFDKFTKEEKEMLEHDRANGTVTPASRGGRGYGGGRGGYGSHRGYPSNKRKIQQLEQQVWELQSRAASQGSETVPEHVENSARSHISEVTQERSIMGGRAEQARQRNTQGRGGHQY